MNITGILAIIIFCLVMYNGIMVKLVDAHKKRKLPKNDDVPHTAPKDFGTKLQIGAGLIFCILIIFLLLANTELLTLLFLVPSIIIYTVVFILAISTVGTLAMSKGESPLTEDENGSLILVGIFVSLIGLLRSSNSEAVSCEEISIIKCLLIAIEHSIHIFLIGALIIRPLKDCANVVITFANKVKGKYIVILNYFINKLRPRKRKYVFSVWLLNKQQETKPWLRVVIVISLVFAIPVDVIGYIIQYTFMLFVWLPIVLIAQLIKVLGEYLLRAMKWIGKLSSRQVAVISFRISIMTAMLIVVISNRYGIINTTEPTTSILEFIASVVIIPIVFEWIHASINGSKQQ